MNKKRRIAAVVVGAALLELFYFNASYFWESWKRERPNNVEYSMSDLGTVNWEKTPQGLRSQADPILYRTGVDMDVAKVEITAHTDRDIPYVFVFYTDEAYPEFCEQTMVAAQKEEKTGTFTAQLPGAIHDIRVDLGDDPGLELYEVTLCINPLRLEFSIARFVTMLVVCFGFWGLTRLQGAPEYNLTGIGDGKEEKEGEER